MTQESLTVPSRAPEGWAVASEEGVAALASPHSETRRDGDALRAGLGGEEAARILAESNSGVRPDLSRRGYRFVKRAFDIVASGAAIAVLFVPALALCAAICLKSPGAGPLYSQIRVGRLRKDGSYRLFRMWKLRSMVPNADQTLDELKERNEADGPLFKIKDDPRIIPGLGHFIRRHSVDELGQLLNVFVGEIPLRILKTRRVFSDEEQGAFALPANEGRTERTVSSQVVGCFSDGLHAPRNFLGNLTAQASHTREIFAKRVSGTSIGNDFALAHPSFTPSFLLRSSRSIQMQLVIERW